MTSNDLPSVGTTLLIILACSLLPPFLAALSWMIWPLELAR